MPAKSVPMLSERLRPVPQVEQARIDRLIADLDAEEFAVRNKATEALEALGELAEPSLRKVLRGNPSAEMKQRGEKLLAKVADPVPSSEQLRQLRALAALEEIGTAEARRLVESLAKGNPQARLTHEAQMVLDRLEKRTAGVPSQK